MNWCLYLNMLSCICVKMKEQAKGLGGEINFFIIFGCASRSLVSLFSLSQSCRHTWYSCSIKLGMIFLCDHFFFFFSFFMPHISNVFSAWTTARVSLIFLAILGFCQWGNPEKTLGKDCDSWNMYFTCSLLSCWADMGWVAALNTHLCFGWSSFPDSILSLQQSLWSFIRSRSIY